MSRNNELKQYAELQLRMKELKTQAESLKKTAEKQYKTLVEEGKPTSFTFENRGLVKFDKPSPRKTFEFSDSIVITENKLKNMKEAEQAALLEKGDYGWTKSAAFACKVTTV